MTLHITPDDDPTLVSGFENMSLESFVDGNAEHGTLASSNSTDDDEEEEKDNEDDHDGSFIITGDASPLLYDEECSAENAVSDADDSDVNDVTHDLAEQNYFRSTIVPMPIKPSNPDHIQDSPSLSPSSIEKSSLMARVSCARSCSPLKIIIQVAYNVILILPLTVWLSANGACLWLIMLIAGFIYGLWILCARFRGIIARTKLDKLSRVSERVQQSRFQLTRSVQSQAGFELEKTARWWRWECFTSLYILRIVKVFQMISLTGLVLMINSRQLGFNVVAIKDLQMFVKAALATMIARASLLEVVNPIWSKSEVESDSKLRGTLIKWWDHRHLYVICIGVLSFQCGVILIYWLMGIGNEGSADLTYIWTGQSIDESDDNVTLSFNNPGLVNLELNPWHVWLPPLPFRFFAFPLPTSWILLYTSWSGMLKSTRAFLLLAPLLIAFPIAGCVPDVWLGAHFYSLFLAVILRALDLSPVEGRSGLSTEGLGASLVGYRLIWSVVNTTLALFLFGISQSAR